MRPNPIRSHVLAHWFGCGLVPRAPGTVGSAAAIPLHFLLLRVTPALHAVLVLLLTAVGIWVSQRAARAAGTDDPNSVVIDEVTGTLIACWFVRNHGWTAALLAFALFRLFDITKPWVIDRAQHVGPPGLSIMLDDVLAGLAAGVLSFIAGYWM